MTNKHQHTKPPPRYSFGDVQGVLREGAGVSVGWDTNGGDRVTVEFDYLDRAEGKRYHVTARGWRTEVKARDTDEADS